MWHFKNVIFCYIWEILNRRKHTWPPWIIFHTRDCLLSTISHEKEFFKFVVVLRLIFLLYNIFKKAHHFSLKIYSTVSLFESCTSNTVWPTTWKCAGISIGKCANSVAKLKNLFFRKKYAFLVLQGSL